MPFNRATESIPVFATGDLDIFAGAITSGLVNLIRDNDDIVVVADKGNIDPDGCSYMAILLRSDLYDSGEYSQASDIEGMQINSVSVGPSGYLLSQFLESDGLTFDDVLLTTLPPPAVSEAFAGGSIAAAVLPEPWVTRNVASGDAQFWIEAGGLIPDYQVGVIAFGSRLVTEDQEAGIRFMAGYLQAVRQYNEGRTARNIEILMEYTGLSEDELLAACWPPVREDGSLQFAGMQPYLDWALETEQIETNITEEQFWDSYYIDEANARLDEED